MTKLTIATRGSNLALWQAHWVRDALLARSPGLEVALETFKTKGDKILDVTLSKVGGKGLFVKEIQDALLRGDAHIAVHSMKDLPTELPDETVIACIPDRGDPFDAFVSERYRHPGDLPRGARVGTSSLRRASQLLNSYATLDIGMVRGNVETRLRKLHEGQFDAIILAAAGLRRLKLEHHIAHLMTPEEMIPAIGQGALAIECRRDDAVTRDLLGAFHHEETAIRTTAERAFLRTMEGSCQVPLGAYATKREEGYHLVGFVAKPDGTDLLKDERTFQPADAERVGTELARELLERGGRAILAALKATEE